MDKSEVVEIDLRDIWGSKIYNSIKWLTQKDGIEKLNTTLNLDLVDIKIIREPSIFECHILCRGAISNNKVIIENQLGKTNHNYLTRAIVHASNLGAKTIIWITEKAHLEHINAATLLNKHTTDLSFHIVEIHAYKMENSRTVIKFEALASPSYI